MCIGRLSSIKQLFFRWAASLYKPCRVLSICDILSPLLPLYRQGKGVLTYRYSHIVYHFCCGECSCLLHMQMVGWKWLKTATSLRNKPPCQNGIENPTSSHLAGFLLTYRSPLISFCLGIIYHMLQPISSIPFSSSIFQYVKKQLTIIFYIL